jgi:hypothetical protein
VTSIRLSAAVTAAALVVGSAPAGAQPPGLKGALNGTFRAQSNGDYATSNQMFYDEATVVATWTVSSTCANPTDCTGTISSDQGWSAPIYKQSDLWHVKRVLARWEPCPDGSAADGLQHYHFYAVNAVTGQADNSQADLFAGLDDTTGPSGACGINKPLMISMPFKLERIPQTGA